MAADVGHWLRTRSQGGPRSRPRDEHTVRMNLNRVHPLLLTWAGHYVHLREVTTADVIAATGLLPGSLRRQTLTALRSLFGHCKKTGRIFRDPTRGVRDGQRPLILIQPLQPAEIDQATSAAVTPAARLAVALAAVHAARPKTIRELHLDDVDLGNRRLVIAGRARPLDDLTRSLLLAWLQHRGRRWPGTANPHLIINQQTAMTTRAVSENWLTEICRGLTATLERLRVDRQLEEALTCGADPLHLAAVFGIDDTTAIKYATVARQLLQTAAEQHDPSGSREPKDQTAHRALKTPQFLLRILQFARTLGKARPPVRTPQASFPARGSPAITPRRVPPDLHGGHRTQFRRSALRVPHCYLNIHCLAPFALQAVLSPSLAGRYSCDYYGASVTVGLAPRR